MKKKTYFLCTVLTIFLVATCIITVATSTNNTKTAWWLVRSKTHETPGVNTKLSYSLADYKAIYVGDTSKKIIYLTFDEGYENGYTPAILDALKKQEVKATFFVTLPYLEKNADLIKRIVAEGHIVGNHSHHHPSMPSIATNTEKFNQEITNVSSAYQNLTGSPMPAYFRPPMGEYSETSLALTKELGYTTVFWSFAYHDWDPSNQPSLEKARSIMVDNLHPGAIYLLHAVSKSNTAVLEDFIKVAKAEGYTFSLLP